MHLANRMLEISSPLHMQLSTALHYHLEDSRVEILEKENGRVTATNLFPKKQKKNIHETSIS
jgi:hypothetical protein